MHGAQAGLGPQAPWASKENSLLAQGAWGPSPAWAPCTFGFPGRFFLRKFYVFYDFWKCALVKTLKNLLGLRWSMKNIAKNLQKAYVF